MGNEVQDKNDSRRAILGALKAHLRSNKLDGWLQPLADEFQGEYPAPYARRLERITGFTGSAGTALITANDETRDVVFVDGRYTLQAAHEVDASCTDVVLIGETSISSYLRQHYANAPAVIGYDGWLFTTLQMEKLQADCPHIRFVSSANAVDAVSAELIPMPTASIMRHADALAGQSAVEKLSALKDFLAATDADAMLLTQPDALCWLLNIRGADIDYNPLVLGYGLLEKSGKLHYYMTPRDTTLDMQDYLHGLGVQFHPLNSLFQHAREVLSPLKTIALDSAHTPHALTLAAVDAGCAIKRVTDPLTLRKACKNSTEITAITSAHLMDGAALSTALCRIDQSAQMDELTAMRIIEEARAANPRYRGASFATIAGSGPNGAVVHYHASKSTNRAWQEGELLLIDSGGQYEEGTTDVTRVLVRGAVSDDVKHYYTRVLKGHIALATAVFPEGTTGAHLDVLARQFLWEIGADYDHGTGHGIGAYLCVHEGPQSISKRSITTPLMAGMVCSNEPGYYQENAFGIRIENVVVVAKKNLPNSTRAMLGFDTLTLVPIETSLVNVAMLTERERAWLNDYHAKVYAAIASQVPADVATWLKRKCVGV